MLQQSPCHVAAAAAGACFVEEAGWQMPAHFGDRAQEYQQAKKAAAIFDVSHRGKLHVTGSDAASFLHNLCTNDVKKLSIGDGCEAFFCNVQARVLSHAYVHHGQEGFWLDVAPGENAKLLKHLDHYLVSEQVEFADRTTELAQLLVAGPQARAVVSRALACELPDLQNLQQRDGLTALGNSGQIRRYDLLGVSGYALLVCFEDAQKFWLSLTEAGAVRAGLEAYEILRVEAGTPVYGKDMDESKLAPEVGRTQQAISYTKGCYLGQEPIVRIRDLGHVNRYLVGIRISGTVGVPRGAKLLREGKEEGVVTTAVQSPIFGPIALAYVRRGSHIPGTALDLETDGGKIPAVTVALPFVG